MFHSSLTKTTSLPTLRNLVISPPIYYSLGKTLRVILNSYTWDPVAKLKECFNINQPFHSCQAAGQCSHFRSKSHDRSASASHHANAGNQNLFSPDNTNNGHTQSRNNHGKDCSISFSSSSQSLKHQAFPQTPNSALFKDDANNILTLLCELQYEVANV
ncbi:hypothetical protein RIR_jg8998.t1 [Rhizophagus irregularis DAOM 181602=DAOM 197198]|nr:hypothetical protein RIR_jg8998.t1 [Rhizophagus irregularis DAOM 181602=DAOM 197198]